MLAGKTTISKPIRHHAAMRLVNGNTRSKANKTSHIPVIKISSSCKGTQ